MKLCSSCPNTCHKSRGERVQHRVVEQVVDVPVLWFMEEIVKLVTGEVVCNACTGVKRQHGWTCTQASGDSTGGRAQSEQIVDVPVPRIWEQSVEVIKVIPEEWMSKRIVQQIVDVPVPQIPKQIVEVVLVILQEQCQ